LSDVTRILQSIDSGDSKAAGELLPLVYEELRRLAAAKMAKERPGQTLQPTALVHEAWIRLAGEGKHDWKNRAHFIGVAAEAMRRVLIDLARSKGTQRRGGGWKRVDFEHACAAVEDDEDLILAINEAIEKLESEDPIKAQIVKFRYFLDLNQREIGEALGISEATVRRHWAFARSWLYAELQSEN